MSPKIKKHGVRWPLQAFLYYFSLKIQGRTVLQENKMQGYKNEKR